MASAEVEVSEGLLYSISERAAGIVDADHPPLEEQVPQLARQLHVGQAEEGRELPVSEDQAVAAYTTAFIREITNPTTSTGASDDEINRRAMQTLGASGRRIIRDSIGNYLLETAGQGVRDAAALHGAANHRTIPGMRRTYFHEKSALRIAGASQRYSRPR